MEMQMQMKDRMEDEKERSLWSCLCVMKNEWIEYDQFVALI